MYVSTEQGTMKDILKELILDKYWLYLWQGEAVVCQICLVVMEIVLPWQTLFWLPGMYVETCKNGSVSYEMVHGFISCIGVFFPPW